MEVHKYDIEGNYVRSYESTLIASKANGLKSDSRIRTSALTEEGISGGFQWRLYRKDKIDVHVEFKREISVKVGDILPSNLHGNFEVLSREHTDKHNNNYFKIKFLNTGGENTSTIGSIKTGQVRDYLAPTFSGIGFLGQDYPRNTKEINTWRSMLSRCYNERDHSYKIYGEKGVTVDREWHNFSNFYKDIKEVDGWDEEKFLASEIELDKDLKQLDIPVGERIYSKDTCTFLAPSENSRLAVQDRIVSFSALSPDGVYYQRESNVYKFCRLHRIKNVDKIYPLISGKAYENMDASKTIEGWAFGLPNEDKDILINRQNRGAYSLEKQKADFFATSPEGVIYRRKGIGVFAREFGLSESDKTHISGCLNGERKSVRGWTFQRVKEEELNNE